MFSIEKEIRDDPHCAENFVTVESEERGMPVILEAQPLKIIPVKCRIQSKKLVGRAGPEVL